MKNFKRKSFLSFAILAILLAQLFGGVVLALDYEIPPEQEIVVEELVPMAVSGACDDYTYYNLGWTIDNVVWNNGWTLSFYNKYHADIYNSSGAKIGRYDEQSTFGQDPHFHIDSTAGMHYWVYF